MQIVAPSTIVINDHADAALRAARPTRARPRRTTMTDLGQNGRSGAHIFTGFPSGNLFNLLLTVQSLLLEHLPSAAWSALEHVRKLCPPRRSRRLEAGRSGARTIAGSVTGHLLGLPPHLPLARFSCRVLELCGPPSRRASRVNYSRSWSRVAVPVRDLWYHSVRERDVRWEVEREVEPHARYRGGPPFRHPEVAGLVWLR